MNLGGVVQSGQEALAKNCERIPCAAGNDSHKPMQDTKVVIAVHVRQGTGRSKILRVYIYIYMQYIGCISTSLQNIVLVYLSSILLLVVSILQSSKQ